jgi:AcrR family transcriptional regulator
MNTFVNRETPRPVHDGWEHVPKTPARPPARPARKPSAPPRRRRTAEQARSAILDAAEKRLVAAGPGAIRLQEVAADVGVSHPTVLHHFGSREGLVEAVVVRALDSLKAVLLAAVRSSTPDQPGQVEAMLDNVFSALVEGGHGRAFLWLALSGYVPTGDELRVRSVADAVHEVRKERHKAMGLRVPPPEDTYFTVLLPALALLSMSVMGHEDDPTGPGRFRAWLAKLIHEHLKSE